MAYEVQTAVIAGVAGLISGGVSSLATPWVNWRLSEKKAKREARVKVVADARGLVSTLSAQPGSPRPRLQRDVAYLSIRPHLQAQQVIEIESGAGSPLENLREAIDDLEKTWALP